MPKVKIYTTTTCPYCRAEKKYLTSKGIKFEDIVLDQQPEEIQTSVDTCGSNGVPCTHITKDDGSEINILGFDQPKIDEALGLN
ncbi:MAG TPA: glutaredoxin domain-containing protein [Candidatus Saccharimonadales bacterium]|nr:glutaredoxin domain-containing protein [Candidatus Saccharimonadales bacterium]